MFLPDAIKVCLQLRNHVTISELAKVSGKKYGAVAEEIARNTCLLRIDRKRGVILGFSNFLSKYREKLFEEGKTYRHSTYNYGDKCLETTNEQAKSLYKNICCGWLGDSYMKMVIPDTPENITALSKLGMVDESTIKLPIEKVWDYPIKQMNCGLS